MSKDTTTQLDRIEADILKQNVCPELAKQATQLVFGDGSPDADVVFIGEAPGKKEDEQGKPFVGAAGKFLDEMLAMIQLDRSEVYITNIVKYRPPNNRDPLPGEKQAFLPYLQAQLEAIAPKVVVTLGRHSMNCFLPDLQISKVHGQPKRIKLAFTDLVGDQRADGVQGDDEKRTEPYSNTAKGVSQSSTQQSAAKRSSVSGFAGKQDALTLVILPLYHPAAALYNGGMRQTLIDDFQTIPAILKKIT
ncbi:MAG: uracil-DNA glycosylase [Candidatus Saccharibacteria bacterium]|nr:uracil-DNA glycosylase [Candidatus Saccharibacteria bacterium]